MNEYKIAWVLARKLGSYYEFVAFSGQQEDGAGYGFRHPIKVDVLNFAHIWDDKAALIDEISMLKRWGVTHPMNIGDLNEWRVMKVERVWSWRLMLNNA